MRTEFSKEFLPEWCDRCDQQGVYFVDDATSSYLVIHKKCGHEALSVWCQHCETGFALPNKHGEHPFNWVCPTCKATYPLPESTFQKPVNLYLEDDLPDDVRLRVLPKNKIFITLSKVSNIFRNIFTLTSFVGLVISISLHLIFLLNGVRNKSIEAIVWIILGTMFAWSYKSLGSYFRRFPWHGKVIPIVFLLYGIWHLFIGPSGNLNELAPGLREVAIFHQAVFLQGLIIGGYIFFCYYWFSIYQEQARKSVREINSDAR